jgi:hypothetical protein
LTQRAPLIRPRIRANRRTLSVSLSTRVHDRRAAARRASASARRNDCERRVSGDNRSP